jgi:uncharacterized protein (DUF2164 family)
MPRITFSEAEKATIIPKVQQYFRAELDSEIGGFEAEFLLDFFANEIGGHFYNRGIYDAQAVLETQLDNIKDALYQLEQDTDHPSR